MNQARIAELQSILADVVPGLPGDEPRFDVLRQELADLCAAQREKKLAEQTEDYLYGSCHIMAVALSLLLGKDILAATVPAPAAVGGSALTHCWVQLKNDLVADAGGAITTKQSLNLYPDGDEASVNIVTADQLLKLGEGVSFDRVQTEAKIAAAMEFAKLAVIPKIRIHL